MRKSVKFLLMTVCILLLILCVFSCADFTDYPDDGDYLSEYPYFFYHIDRFNGSHAEIDYNGKQIEADVGMMGSAFDVCDKEAVKKDEEGEPYLDAEDIIIRGSWSTDKEGNIILEIDNGSRIVLNKKAAAE